MNEQIIQIKVTDLFGFLEHTVDLKDEGITFIHGPNGCGKTTLLKLISSFFTWQISNLFDINFSSLSISYSNGEIIRIIKTTELKSYDDEEISIPKLVFKIEGSKEKTEDFSISGGIRNIKIPASEIDEYIPNLNRIGARTWLDVQTGQHLSYYEVIDNYAHRLPYTKRHKKPDWLQKYREITKLHFVRTQRLLKLHYEGRKRVGRNEHKATEVIQIYSDEIQDTIRRKLAESALISQTRDRSFPERLLTMALDPTLSEERIREDYQITEERIQSLMETGLIDKEKNISLPKKSLEATEKKVLSLYLQDINEKLNIFDDLQKKIETYLNIVSPKLRNKKFRIERHSGFVFEVTKGNKTTLSPIELSSGEQHQIVLFYELIFKSQNNSFFLIDEPEISLHVDWQRQFMSDISKITELGNHYFLIATHSPQIIGSRRDLSIALDGGILDV